MSKPPGIIWLQWHDNPEPTWECDNIHEDDVKYGLYSEIERLTLVTEGQLSEIGRLRAQVAELVIAPRDLRARVEELEHIQRHSYIGACVCPAHHITNEMIDAAWQSAGEFDNGIEVLEMLNIFRCEMCNGTGGVCISTENGDFDGDCGACGGRGYTLTGKEKNDGMDKD